jgi:hypothetical protein
MMGVGHFHPYAASSAIGGRPLKPAIREAVPGPSFSTQGSV